MANVKTLALAIAMACTAGAAGAADDYPNRPVTFLVPYAAGANGDIVSRIVAADLQNRLGQAVVVENRPGAGGNIGAAEVKKNDPDGYVFMLATNTHTINQNLYPDAGFDLRTDFEPVAQISTTNMLLLVNPSVPANTLQEYVDLAKSKELSYSSGGNGASGHLYMELLNVSEGIETLHVPYKGVAAGLTDLIAGRVDATMSSISSTLEMVKAGELKPIAIAASERSPLLPDVPTFAELGVSGLTQGTWQGVVVPAGTPAEVVGKLNAALLESLADPKVKEQLEQQGVSAAPSAPDAFRTLIADDIDRWADVIGKAGITLQ